MDFPVLLKFTHLAGLAAVLFGSLGYVQIVASHLVQRPMDHRANRSLRTASTVMVAGVLAFGFSSGGLFASDIFASNAMAPFSLMSIRVVALAGILTSAVYLHVFARAKIADLGFEPLCVGLSVNLIMGMTSAAGVLLASWMMWAVAGLNLPEVVELSVFGHMATVLLLVLILWLGFATPMIAMRMRHSYLHPQMAQWRQAQGEAVQHFEVHAIPVRKNHRPALMQ